MKMKVGFNDYELKRFDNMDKVINEMNMEEDKYVSIDGACNPWKRKIRIVDDEGNAAGYNEQTLWHELVHAMLHEIGRSDLWDDEVLVDNLGKIIWSFLKNNNLVKIYEYLGERTCKA